MASKKRPTHEIEEGHQTRQTPPPTKKQKFPSPCTALFTSFGDLKEFQTIYNTLKIIYTNHPSSILHEIAKFST